MEGQVGAPGLVLNALVLRNTRSMDAAVNQLCADVPHVAPGCAELLPAACLLAAACRRPRSLPPARPGPIPPLFRLAKYR